MAWSSIQFAQYNSDEDTILAVNGTHRKRITGKHVFEWGIDAPETRPVLAAGSSTGLTGDYNLEYTYGRKEGFVVVSESNPSPAADAAVTLANEDLSVTWTDPTDDQVNCIRLYRTSAGGTLYLLERTVPFVNTDWAYSYDWEAEDEYLAGYGYKFTGKDEANRREVVFSWELSLGYEVTDNERRHTTAADNINTLDLDTIDDSLGAEAETDHDRPPKGSYVFGPSFSGKLFMLYEGRLYYSKSNQPEYIPVDNWIDVSPSTYPGQLGLFFNEQPFVLTKTGIIYISGAGSTDSPFLAKTLESRSGPVGPMAAVAVHGKGLYYVANDGIYLFSPNTALYSGQDINITQKEFAPIFDGTTTNGVAGVGSIGNSWLIQFENKLYFGYPGSADTYPKNILVLNLDSDKVEYFTRAEEMVTVCVDKYNNRLLGVDSTGYIWHMENPDDTDDDGTAIAWEVQSKDFTLQTRRYFPRWVKYDVDASDQDCTATGALVLDGSDHHTHTITGERVTRRRLVDEGNGRRMGIKISGSGPVTIYAAEAE